MGEDTVGGAAPLRVFAEPERLLELRPRELERAAEPDLIDEEALALLLFSLLLFLLLLLSFPLRRGALDAERLWRWVALLLACGVPDFLGAPPRTARSESVNSGRGERGGGACWGSTPGARASLPYAILDVVSAQHAEQWSSMSSAPSV